LFFFILILSCKRDNDSIYSKNKLDNHLEEVYNSSLAKEKKLEHLDSAVNIVSKLKDNDSLKIKNTFKIANRYYTLLEYKKYYQTSKKALELSIKQHDTLNIAKSEYYIGDYFFFTSKNDSAYYYYLKAEKKYNKLNDEFNLAKTLLHIAYVLLYERDYLGSEAQTIKVLNIAHEINDPGLVYECYVNLGSSLSGLKNYEKALEYHFKALDQIEKLENDIYTPLYRAQVLNNIGYVYINLNEYSNALNYYSKALEIENFKQLHPILYSSVLSYSSYSKFKLNDKKAIFGLEETLRIRDSINDISGKIKSRIHLTEYYLTQKDTLKAIELNQQAYDLAKSANYNEEVLLTLDMFTKLKPNNGLKFAKEYMKFSDSLQEQERNTRNKLARIEYETDEIIHDKEVLTEQRKLIIGTSLIIISFGFLLYIILYQRGKQKELVFIQKQQFANEEIYKLMINQQLKIDEVKNTEKNRIAKELHDGVMNKLTSTRLNLFILSRKRDDETIENCIGYINDIQNIEKEVRSIAHELSNDVFAQKNGFKNILKELIDDQNKLFSAKCISETDKTIKWEKIDISVKMNLYRIIQESLNNCNKYANASEINIHICKKNLESITLTIEDNGIGFNLNKKKYGIGIKNMSERAESIGGNFEINSKINKGTIVLIEFPQHLK